MNLSFFWDLDGTLINSYDAIVSSLLWAFEKEGFILDAEKVHEFIIASSTADFVNKMSVEKGVSPDRIRSLYNEISVVKNDKITLIDGAKEILEFLFNRGDKHFIVTHRGDSSFDILKNFKIDKYFTEVITVKRGFERKPSPEAVNYLIEKYKIDREKAYFVGDRKLDMDCATNAKIKGIFFIPKESPAKENGLNVIKISELCEIEKIVE